MKFPLLSLILLFAFACKSGKESSTAQSDKEVIMSNENAWTRKDYKPTKEMQLPSSYNTYLLNSNLFQQQLDNGLIELPLNDGFQQFKVEESNTISDDMREKFPQLNSYKGVSLENKLCQCTIDKKENNYSIAVFCNDKTIYIKDLFKNGIYFVYDKKDVPEGIGTVNE